MCVCECVLSVEGECLCKESKQIQQRNTTTKSIFKQYPIEVLLSLFVFLIELSQNQLKLVAD